MLYRLLFAVIVIIFAPYFVEAKIYRKEDAPLFSDKYIKEIVAEFEPSDENVKALKSWQDELRQINDLFNPQRPGEKALHNQFFRDFFVKALGFKMKETGSNTFTIEDEFITDVDKTRPDGVLGFLSKDKNKNDVRVVIELKAPGINLDARQNRQKDRRTPVDQAFSYAHKFDNVEWIIVSNYEEVRLYQRQTSKYSVKFDLNFLKEHELKLLFLLLSKDNLLAKEGESVTNRLFREREEQLKRITNKFYEDYKEVRLKTARHILQKHPEIEIDKAVNMSQVLLDRILFIAFLEDYSLIKFPAIKEAYASEYRFNPTPAWDRFKTLFKYMDKGNDKYGIPPYNGGLFRGRPDIEALDIDEEILAGYAKLSGYDFKSDLRVRILGHVFEKSITDLTYLKLELQGQAGKEKDTRQHDEGAFYTTESVTSYIVERTVGVHLEDLKEKLGIYELPDLRQAWQEWKSGLSDKDKNKNTDFQTWLLNPKNPVHQQHLEFWQTYMAELLKIKIIDPSCGSGAFLVAAFDYLVEEGKRINKKIMELNPGQALFARWDTDLIKNNLFGVDVSEEAIEITKLSLWLQIAKNREALPALDSNILKANAAVSNEEWQKLFPEIMANGGFDIVIGNPPYLRQELFTEAKPQLEEDFPETYAGRADLYVYFYQVGHNILKENGYLGYITSNKWMRRQYGKKLRKFTKETVTINYLMDLEGLQIFDDAFVDTGITIFKKSSPQPDNEIIISEAPFFDEEIIIKQEGLSENGYHLEGNPIFSSIREKMESAGNLLANWKIKIKTGVKTGHDESFVIDTVTKEKLIKEDPKSAEIIKPLLRGRDIEKWYVNWQGYWLIYAEKETDINAYSAIEKYLNLYRTELESRAQGQEWYELQRSRNSKIFTSAKIIYPTIKKGTAFILDKDGYYTNDATFSIVGEDLPYLSAILNSNLLYWYFINSAPVFEGERIDLKSYVIERTPVPQISKEKQKPFITLSDELHELAKERHKITSTFWALIQSDFQLGTLGDKLENWHAMDFAEFAKRLKDKKAILSGKQKEEWMERFNRRQAEIKELDEQIMQAEQKLNELVYELYGLTAEEIAYITENSQ